MTNIVKTPEQLYRIMDNLHYNMIKVPDLYRNHPENFIELSHPFYRMIQIGWEFQPEIHQDFETRSLRWRGQFKIKVVHNIVKDYLIEGPELIPQSKFEEPEYLAFRYTRMNGRVAYLDWQYNQKTWI